MTLRHLTLACLIALSAAAAQADYFSGGSGAWLSPAPMFANPPAAGCSQATTYLARTSGGNEGGNAANITTLICGLVTDGVITGNLSTTGCGSTLDVLYILAQQNSTDALLNICTSSKYNATLSGAPTFTTLVGFSGLTTTSFINTNLNASTATSPDYIQNSATLGAWIKATDSDGDSIMGTSSSGIAGETNLDPTQGSSFFGRINSSTGSASGVTSPNAKGLYTTERTSSSATTLYFDGASLGSVTDTSAAPENAGFTIGFVSGNSFGTTKTLCEAHIGAALGATLQLALYTRLRAYMTAVGVP